MSSFAVSRRVRGLIEISIAGFAFGFLGVFGRLAYRTGLSPGELLTARFALASFILAAGLAMLSPKKLRITNTQLLVCAGLGVLGYAVFSSLYFLAIQGLSVALASLLLYTYPVLVALGAHLAFKERLSKPQALALPLALIGLAILLSGGALEIHSKTAVLAGLGSAVCYATYILTSSRLQKEIDPLTSGFYVICFATLGLACIHRPSVSTYLAFSHEQILIVIGIAIVCTILPMIFFLSGLQKLGNTEASLLSTLEPVTAATMGSLLLGEVISGRELSGGGLVLCALVITVLGDRSKKDLTSP